MDNPQHYQPLSHALNPPHTASASQSHFSTYDPPTTSNGVPIGARPEEEEEEDDDDEGIVEEQLNDNDHEHETHHVGSSDASSKAKPNRCVFLQRKTKLAIVTTFRNKDLAENCTPRKSSVQMPTILQREVNVDQVVPGVPRTVNLVSLASPR
jgi:hypothetical protein